MKLKESVLHRIIAAFLTVLLVAGAAGAKVKDHKAFAALSARLSEPGGYFDSDNLISNETSYQHVLIKMREIGVAGGVYVGVGPDQNFTYIARIRPRLAIIIDIRRDNLLQHLMFKALFERSRNRIEYLCRFLGKPFPKTKGWDQKSIKDIVEYLDNTPADAKLFDKYTKDLRSDVQRYGIPLTQGEMETIGKIHRAFFMSGLDIRYSSYHRPPRSIYPTYRDLLLERDLTGQQNNYFNLEDDFQFLKRMEADDMIVPIVGDLSGPQAVKAIGAYLNEIKERVSAFYVSNVEFYLHRQGSIEKWVENLKALPIDSHSIIIRSYFNYYAPPHPQAEPNHFSTQLLEKIEDMIKICTAGDCGSYEEIVTKNSILLH